MKTVALIATGLLVLLLTLPKISVGDEPQENSNSTLLPLQLERAKVVAEFGLNHPRVKTLDAEIEATSKVPVPSTHVNEPDVTKMDALELRQFVLRLMQRIEKLEQEVSMFKVRESKTELRGR